MIRKIISLSIIFSCFLFSQQYDQYEDVVYLKNGSIIRGMVIEQVPNDYLKIKSGSNIFVYQISDIEKITKELRVLETISYKNTYNSSEGYSYTSSNKGREGFIIGFSYGRQSTELDFSLNYNNNSYNSSSEDDDGTATDFKIGFAPSNSLSIYYTNKVAWYDDDVLSHTGIGATFFLNSSKELDIWKQSAFITASIGRSKLESNSSYGSYNSMEGTGYSFGVGVEPAKNLMIEMVWCFAKIEEAPYSVDYSFSDYHIEYEWEISVFSVTLGLLSL